MARSLGGRRRVVENLPHAGGVNRRKIRRRVTHHVDQEVPSIRQEPGRHEACLPWRPRKRLETAGGPSRLREAMNASFTRSEQDDAGRPRGTILIGGWRRNPNQDPRGLPDEDLSQLPAAQEERD